MERKVLIATILALLAWPAAARPLRLTVDGRSAYLIAIGRDASPSEKRGAQELQQFIEQMSGARLPIVTEPAAGSARLILVGGSDALKRLHAGIAFDALGPEGFALQTIGRHIVIAGGRERGTMYGVYTFLEKLGCRWYTAEVSRIPKMRTIQIGPMNETRKPAFEYREPFIDEAFDRDWAARNRMNGAHMKLDASTGGKLEYFPFVHSFERLIPPKKYFQDHPEYFSLIDGKRRAERSQLCLTNPDVLRLGVEAVLEWIERHPEATIYSVSQNDWTGWCECDNCRRVEEEEGGVHSGPLLRYVNALAAEIEKRHPDKLIDTLAYWYTEAPPSRVRPRRNVRVRLCPIGACEAHPYEQCPHNAYFMKNLRAWSKITDQLYIWHYNTNFSHYLLPFPDFDELAADLPMYRRYGVMGVFLEGPPSGRGAENSELRAYVMARLLWDTKADVKQAVDEFHQAYYGQAAGPMREYFELLHGQVRMAGGRGQHIWIFQHPQAPYLTRAFLEQAGKLFDRAERLAESDAVRRRVRQARLGIRYTELMWAKRCEVQDGWFAPPDLSGLKDRWQSFLAEVRGFGITNLREHAPIANDEAQFARMMRPYRVATIENRRLRADVMPELSGRVLRLLDKQTHKQVLLHGDPGAPPYPNMGGLAAFAYPDFVAQAAFETKWEAADATPGEIRLTGKCANGLTIRRRLRFRRDDAALLTETVLENTSGSLVEATLQSRMEVDPGELAAAEVAFRCVSGAAVRKRLMQPETQPTGSESYSGVDAPAGEWSVTGAGGLVVRNLFPTRDGMRFGLSWSGKGENRVTLAVWSEKRMLAPGESLTLAADYGVE